MTARILFVAGCLLGAGQALAHGEDDPLLFKAVIEQLELRATGGDDPVVWEAEAWLGKDLHKLWLETEGEYVDGHAEEAELQALYSRAVAPYWDVQIGWRHDFRPQPSRDWVAAGFKGLAPYFFEVDAAAFLGGNGRLAARLQAEYELLITQRLVLTPEVEINYHVKDDRRLGIGAGISDIEAGLRLRYEIRREFAPYVGLNWTKKLGGTADFARAEGEDTGDVQAVVGLRAWF